MTMVPELRVTLSAELWREFRRLAAEKSVPLELLVAGLVCDTLEDVSEDERSPAIPNRRYRCNDPITSRIPAVAPRSQSPPR